MPPYSGFVLGRNGASGVQSTTYRSLNRDQTSFNPRAPNRGFVIPQLRQNIAVPHAAAGINHGVLEVNHDAGNSDNTAVFCKAVPLEEEANNITKKRKLSSNFQWRVDFSRIYGDIQAARKLDNTVTLHGYCMERDFLRDRYRRISQIWNELQLDSLLEREVDFDTDEFNDILIGKFPVESCEPKTRMRTKKAVRRTNSECVGLQH